MSLVCDAFIMEGGLEAWKKAGLPVISDRRQPIELQRQMQIGAGSLVLMGTVLGLLVSLWFFTLPVLVGAGLITAGVTGLSGVTRILMRMPWNRAIRCKLDWPHFGTPVTARRKDLKAMGIENVAHVVDGFPALQDGRPFDGD